MALTFTKQQGPTQVGHSFRTHYVVAGDNSYPTGGWSMKASDLGLGNAANTDPSLIIHVMNTYGYSARYDYANQKLMMYTSAGTQTSNATDLSALTDIRVLAYSKYSG